MRCEHFKSGRSPQSRAEQARAAYSPVSATEDQIEQSTAAETHTPHTHTHTHTVHHHRTASCVGDVMPPPPPPYYPRVVKKESGSRGITGH